MASTETPETFEFLSPAQLDDRLGRPGGLASELPKSNLSAKDENRINDEVISVSWLLLTCQKLGSLQYPLRLTKRESPDFLLELPNGHKIGIEHTRAVLRREAQKESFRRDKYPETRKSPYFMTHDSNRRDLEAEIRENKPGHGYVADKAELQWASDILAGAIQPKCSISEKESFEHFDEDWLLVQCQFGLPVIGQESFDLALRFLQALVFHARVYESFPKVFVISGSFVGRLQRFDRSWVQLS